MAMSSKLELGTKNPAGPEKEERTIWEDSDSIGCERELLTLFAHNQIRVALALPLLAVLFALASLTWTSPFNAITWLIAAIGCQMIQVYLCKQYLLTPTNKIRYSDWIGMLSASEFLMAACWSLLVFILWDTANAFEHIYIIATLMAVIAIRIMIAGNFMPVIIAGTGFLTFNVAIRCIIEAQPLYIAAGCDGDRSRNLLHSDFRASPDRRARHAGIQGPEGEAHRRARQAEGCGRRGKG